MAVQNWLEVSLKRQSKVVPQGHIFGQCFDGLPSSPGLGPFVLLGVYQMPQVVGSQGLFTQHEVVQKSRFPAGGELQRDGSLDTEWDRVHRQQTGQGDIHRHPSSVNQYDVMTVPTAQYSRVDRPF